MAYSQVRNRIGIAWKLAFALLLCFAVIFSIGAAKAHAATPSMKIYGMCLGATGKDKTDTKGESVLLESEGNYLLMDLGQDQQVKYVVDQLKALNATSIDLYISHIHIDHVGGSQGNGFVYSLQYLVNNGIKVNNLYLPDQSINVNVSGDYKDNYNRVTAFANNNGWNIKPLKLDSTFSVGSVTAQVIGPFKKLIDMKYTDYSPEGFGDDDNGKTDKEMQYEHLENNLSLTTMFTCGNTKFLTSGDLLDDGVIPYTNKYGNALDCDILKLSHHGTPAGNTEQMFKYTTPSYSFCSNTGFIEKLYSSKDKAYKWETYLSLTNSKSYGMLYQIGSEERSIVYDVTDGDAKTVKMYTAAKKNGPVSTQTGTYMDGWTRLVGGDGTVRDYDIYYLVDGVPVIGAQLIAGRYYYFGTGGAMEFGNGTDLKGWDGEKKIRNYTTRTQAVTAVKTGAATDTKLGVMATGFKWVMKASGKNGGKQISKYNAKADYLYFYDTSMTKNPELIGTKLTVPSAGTNKFKLKAIKTGKKTYKYAMNRDGKIKTSASAKQVVTITIGGQSYFFNSTGKMKSNEIVTYKGKKYYIDKNGKTVKAKKGTKVLVKVGKKTYCASDKGPLITGKTATAYTDTTYKTSAKYLFDKNGVMVKQL